MSKRINPRRTNGTRRNQLIKRALATYTTCHLCGKPIDPTLRGTTHPQAPELDEIIPVSKGGNPYQWDNIRLAHKHCNRQRSNHSIAYARTHTQPHITTNQPSNW